MIKLILSGRYQTRFGVTSSFPRRYTLYHTGGLPSNQCQGICEQASCLPLYPRRIRDWITTMKQLCKRERIVVLLSLVLLLAGFGSIQPVYAATIDVTTFAD